jgi:hypothetical protein
LFRKPAQGQSHDAAFKLRGGLIGVDPERQDDGAREGTAFALLSQHHAAVVNRLRWPVSAHDDGVPVNRDVEIIRCDAWNIPVMMQCGLRSGCDA